MIKAKGDRVMLKPLEEWEANETGEKVTKGGIIIPDETAEKARVASTEGIVVSLGPAAYADYDEPWCEVGEHVLYAKYGGVFIQDPDTKEKYVLLNDTDIICAVMREETDSE